MSLVLETAPPPRLRAFAIAIDRLFPNLDLDEVTYPEEPPDGFYDHWCQVEQMLLTLRIGRAGVHRVERIERAFEHGLDSRRG